MSDSDEEGRTYLDFLKGLANPDQSSDDDSSVEYENATINSDTTIKSLFDATIDLNEDKKLEIANEVYNFLISKDDDGKKKSTEKIFELLIDIRNKRKPKVENIKTAPPDTYDTLSLSLNESQNWINSQGEYKTTTANNENECNDDNISQESKREYKEFLERDTRINEYLREEILKIFNSVRLTIRNDNYANDLANKTITIIDKLISLVDKTISIIKSNKLLTQNQIQEYATFLIENVIDNDKSLHDITERYRSASEIYLKDLNIQNMLLFFILDQIHDNKPNRTGLSVGETIEINSFMSDCYDHFKESLQTTPDNDDLKLNEILEKIVVKNITNFQPEDDLLNQTLVWLNSKGKITLKDDTNEKNVFDASLTRTFAIDNASTIQNPVQDNYRYASPSVILDAGSVISKAINFFIGRPNIIYRLKDGYSFYRTDIYKIENDTIFIEMYMSIFFDNQEICTSSHKLKYMEKYY